MSEITDNRILEKMLDRLFASLVNGPSLNARPHSSRQRLDFAAIDRLGDLSGTEVLRQLLGESRKATIAGKRSPVPRPADDAGSEQRAAYKAYSDQLSVITKLRGIAEDALDYENDTGVHALQIGFPLLSLPPGSLPTRGFTRRVLAPVAMIPLNLAIRHSAHPTVTLECRNHGAELVLPNIALLAWLSRLAGKPLDEFDADENGEKPWEEIARTVAQLCRLASMDIPQELAGADAISQLELRPAPRADEDRDRPQIIPAAVLGLFPMANQGLIRDTQALLDGEKHDGPIQSFLHVDISLEAPPETVAADAACRTMKRDFEQDRLTLPADPFQARAVALARTSRGLVVHGPPGTGKSQTITNIISDHLARGERVLFVCDKRTALDVVMNRLESIGLGHLCAVVHDPRRDQRELYKSIREQLENLTAMRTRAGAQVELQRLDRELANLHASLTSTYRALMDRPDPATASFHELMGQWLSIGDATCAVPRKLLAGATVRDVEDASAILLSMIRRARECDYLNSPWRAAAGMKLDEFLATPLADIRHQLTALAQNASAVDEHSLRDDLAYPPQQSLNQTAAQRKRIAEVAGRILPHTDARAIAPWLGLGAPQLAQKKQELAYIDEQTALLASFPVERELAATHAGAAPSLAEVQASIAQLEGYLNSSKSWHAFFAFAHKRRATSILARYGLPLSPQNASRVENFLKALRVRQLLADAFREGAGWDETSASDVLLMEHAHAMRDLSELCEAVAGDQAVVTAIKAAGDQPSRQSLVDALVASSHRAQAAAELMSAVIESKLFTPAFITQTENDLRQGKPAGELFADLQRRASDIEPVLRTSHDLDRIPPELRTAAAWLVQRDCTAEQALHALKRDAMGIDISARLKASPQLQGFDHQELEAMFNRYAQLEARRQELARDVIAHLWTQRQKDHLLATTGTRLNSSGADLRRRLTIRGENAMRLRQVIGVGQQLGTEGIDPLFDLRPVWMASPETVAEIFPRKAMFDIVVFDEASQCRLEEALPVLLRGERLVVAGDPKQLPPSRFFESAVAVSEDQTIENDQQLFEARQAEIEDLLAAALNIEIEEAYLDVHYRSRNADLIEFSNRHFYSARLQPIPGHPANRARFAPLTLYKAGGTYDENRNLAEAQRVCQIVRDLLRRADPPSIGIASFNLMQRDLILETLDEMCESDPQFAKDLAAARSLRRKGAFEGLFVRNLENVQGDERDHIIISTTYGPDPQGRFYRRFGPLGRAGGGRRLNVLITRAREEVHLVTSIPQNQYRALPDIPRDQTPGGPWLLFSYLAYAEDLAEGYEAAHEWLKRSAAKPELRIRESKCDSPFSRALGSVLLDRHSIGSQVHWGNDGFCIDIALQHPHHAEDVTLGILCDLTRFNGAADPIEWEVFRAAVLQSQGWKLHRLWTPHFFRDPDGQLQTIHKRAQDCVQTEDAKDAIRAG